MVCPRFPLLPNGCAATASGGGLGLRAPQPQTAGSGMSHEHRGVHPLQAALCRARGNRPGERHHRRILGTGLQAHTAPTVLPVRRARLHREYDATVQAPRPHHPKRPRGGSLADHDPNGVDMTRDNRKRLRLSARAEVEVRRIALTMDQVRRYNPPPSFAKEKDKRFPAYVREFGTRECWELDALSPTVIADLIRTEVEALIEPRTWRKAQSSEQRGRKLLDAVAGNWSMVEKSLAKR